MGDWFFELLIFLEASKLEMIQFDYHNVLPHIFFKMASVSTTIFLKVESFLFEWTHWTGVFPFESLPFFWAFCCAARHNNRLLGSCTAAAATVVVAAALGPRRRAHPPRGNLRGIRAVPKSLERWGCRREGIFFSKVVSTHLWNTPRSNLYQQGYEAGIPLNS